MLDYLLLLLGPTTVQVVCTVIVLGALRGRPDATPSYVCDCTHPLAVHDPMTRRCHVEKLMRVTSYSRELVRCACRQYVGDVPPEPVDWAARVAGSPLPTLPPGDAR